MSRRSRQRRKLRRARKEAQLLEQQALASVPRADTPLTDAQVAHALSRFTSMRTRGGVRLSLGPFGPLVTAANPDELLQATNDALVAATLAAGAIDA